MEVEITPTEKIDKLEQNLDKRVKSIEKKDGKLIAQTENHEKLGKIPGIDIYKFEKQEKQGLKGKPIEKPAYAKLESKKDAVKCLLATIEGYDLRILNTGREWDLRRLKKYNPDIKHLKTDKPPEVLEIDKSISDLDKVEKISIDMPDNQEEIKKLYQEMLT